MAWAEDLNPFLRDLAVDVRRGGVTARGVLDTPTSAALGGLVTLDEHQLTLPADALPGIGHGDTVTIARTEYVVREVFLLDDGALKRVTLRVV
jgi:hypothetical protein